MFSLAKWVMSMYIPLITKMAKDNASLMVAKVNFEFFCDMNLLISLSCMLPMLETVHALIKFAHKRDIFVRLYCSHQNLSRIALFSLFKSCHKICLRCFQRIPRFGCLQSQQNAFEMQGDILRPQHLGVEYLCFDFVGFTF